MNEMGECRSVTWSRSGPNCSVHICHPTEISVLSPQVSSLPCGCSRAHLSVPLQFCSLSAGPHPGVPDSGNRGGTGDPAFLTSSQVLLVWGPHSERLCFKAMQSKRNTTAAIDNLKSSGSQNFKKGKETGEIDFNILYLTLYILLFPHVANR